MSRTFVRTQGAVLALVIGLCAAGCGGGPGPPSPTTTTSGGRLGPAVHVDPDGTLHTSP